MRLVAAIAFLRNRDLTVSGWQSVDLTNAAIAWRNGRYPNDGVWIRGGRLVNDATFALHGNTTPMKRPKPGVSYLPPCP